MEKIFTILEVPEEKKVKIGTFYLIGEADIWWITIKIDLACQHSFGKISRRAKTSILFGYNQAIE